MMKNWWCMECQTEVALGRHGQCEVCGSEAVDPIPTEGELNCSVPDISSESDPVPTCS